MSTATAYPPAILNTQQLLFGQTKPVHSAGHYSVPVEYYRQGWVLVDGVADELEAVAIQEKLLGSVDATQLPLHQRFADRIQLAKADLIPVCDDIVTTSYQVLHFDMGHPLVESNDQLLVTHVGLYVPQTTSHEVAARTRLVPLGGLLGQLNLPAPEIERRLVEYVRQHGDGWADHNTYRLSCFARFLDALGQDYELENETDKTVGQWFQHDQKLAADNAYRTELAFYLRHGIDLENVEHRIALQPGQLLLLDNTRVIHGRVGERRAKEIYNFMFGVQAIDQQDIAAVREYICNLTSRKNPL